MNNTFLKLYSTQKFKNQYIAKVCKFMGCDTQFELVIEDWNFIVDIIAKIKSSHFFLELNGMQSAYPYIKATNGVTRSLIHLDKFSCIEEIDKFIDWYNLNKPNENS